MCGGAGVRGCRSTGVRKCGGLVCGGLACGGSGIVESGSINQTPFVSLSSQGSAATGGSHRFCSNLNLS